MCAGILPIEKERRDRKGALAQVFQGQKPLSLSTPSITGCDQGEGSHFGRKFATVGVVLFCVGVCEKNE